MKNTRKRKGNNEKNQEKEGKQRQNGQIKIQEKGKQNVRNSKRKEDIRQQEGNKSRKLWISNGRRKVNKDKRKQREN